MRRTSRLSAKVSRVRDTRLDASIRAELKNMPDNRLDDFLSAKKVLFSKDDILAAYHELANEEKQRRVKLAKSWGKESPHLPSKGEFIAGELYHAPSRLLKHFRKVT